VEKWSKSARRPLRGVKTGKTVVFGVFSWPAEVPLVPADPRQVPVRVRQGPADDPLVPANRRQGPADRRWEPVNLRQGPTDGPPVPAELRRTPVGGRRASRKVFRVCREGAVVWRRNLSVPGGSFTVWRGLRCVPNTKGIRQGGKPPARTNDPSSAHGQAAISSSHFLFSCCRNKLNHHDTLINRTMPRST
jgi:hypothetical protein